MSIELQVGPGELIDKLTILEVKLARIEDPAKLRNVRVELDLVRGVCERELPPRPELDELRARLAGVNEALWDIEDALREQERKQDFSDRFVELARAVYKTNDRRAAIKHEINLLIGSEIIEEKSYSEY